MNNYLDNLFSLKNKVAIVIGGSRGTLFVLTKLEPLKINNILGFYF